MLMTLSTGRAEMDRFTEPPKDFSPYKRRLENLVERLKDDQFVTVRVDVLRHLLGHEDYPESLE